MDFHWSLSDSNSPQVSSTLLSILAVPNYAVIWIVSTRPPISKSSRPFNYPLVIVPKAPITIGTIVIFMFHSFFNSLARSRYLSFFSDSKVGFDLSCSFSVLSVLHSMFPYDGSLVFSLFTILFTFSTFVFCSCDSVSSVSLGSVAFLFSIVGSSFLVCCFWMASLDVTGIVLSCFCVFWCISSISRPENHPFFIVLTWSASLWLVVWKLAHFCLISIIFFLQPLCEGLLLK